MKTLLFITFFNSGLIVAIAVNCCAVNRCTKINRLEGNKKCWLNEIKSVERKNVLLKSEKKERLNRSNRIEEHIPKCIRCKIGSWTKKFELKYPFIKYCYNCLPYCCLNYCHCCCNFSIIYFLPHTVFNSCNLPKGLGNNLRSEVYKSYVLQENIILLINTQNY